MTNPFELIDKEYVVLVNEEGQYSLWPCFADVPHGWTIAHPAAGRDVCLAFVERRWTDMRPLSLVASMGQTRS